MFNHNCCHLPLSYLLPLFLFFSFHTSHFALPVLLHRFPVGLVWGRTLLVSSNIQPMCKTTCHSLLHPCPSPNLIHHLRSGSFICQGERKRRMDGKEGAGGEGRLGWCIFSHLKLRKQREKPALKAHLYLQFSPFVVLFCTMGNEQ